GPRALGRGGGHEAELGEGVGVLFALAEVDCRCDGRRDQLGQAIRDLRGLWFTFDPLLAIAVILGILLLAAPVPVLANQQIGGASFVAVHMLGNQCPLFAGAVGLELRQAELLADVIAALDRIIAGEAVDHEAVGRVLVRPHRQRAIARRVAGSRAENLAANYFTLKRLRELAQSGEFIVASVSKLAYGLTVHLENSSSRPRR